MRGELLRVTSVGELHHSLARIGLGLINAADGFQ